MSSTQDEDPSIFAGQYEHVGYLGQGRYGYVAEVFDHRLRRNVALKVFAEVDPQHVWEEAQALERVRGQYILEVRHAGLHLGKPFVVTEVARNGTVAQQIVRDVGLPPATAVQWARQVCRGIARMHDDGLVHRDIKPANLFLTDRDDVLVGDLGNARLLGPEGFASAGGSEPTMSPEVAEALCSTTPPKPIYGAASDIYSIGATLYWMVSGRPPRLATSPEEVRSMTAPDVWEVAPHVTRGLRDVINQAISDDRAQRFSSAVVLDSALGNITRTSWSWVRTPPHLDHVQCFVGSRGTTTVNVCAVPTGRRTQIDIRVRYAPSGRRIRRAERTASRRQLARALRSAFRVVES